MLQEPQPQDMCTMGVDTGRLLHVVVSSSYPHDENGVRRKIVFIGVVHSYAELDELMGRFNVQRCVIDALPEIHATRAFAERHGGRVFQNYFNEHQRGSFAWKEGFIVEENRTEALDASRQVVRKKRVILPRQNPIVQEFAQHLSNDAKQLVENEKTGVQEYRYIRTGTNHYSMAFTYDCVAWSQVMDPRWIQMCGWIA